MYIYIYTYIYIYIYTHTYIHTHAYIHMHIHAQSAVQGLGGLGRKPQVEASGAAMAPHRRQAMQHRAESLPVWCFETKPRPSSHPKQWTFISYGDSGY